MLPTDDLYLGVLSGTSLDSIDCVLVHAPTDTPPRQLAAWHPELPAELRSTLNQLCHPGANEINQAGQVGQAFARHCAGVVQQFLARHELPPSAIKAIGFHGQTVRHHPNGPDGFTLQLGEPATLAVLTGIPVVGQFRSPDIALGGQGAPLAPALHHLLLANQTPPTALVNLGGIANVTVVSAEHELIGFDTGPANILLDNWAQQHLGQPYDAGGAWAASGQVVPELLAQLLTEPYFTQPWPKSTGRETFHRSWLEQALAQLPTVPPAVDVQATLLELTARTLTAGLQQVVVPRTVYAAGGGAHNTALQRRCAALLPDSEWRTVAALGIDPDGLEGVLFGWLAACHVQGQALDLGAVTGARQALLPGAWHPAPDRPHPGS